MNSVIVEAYARTSQEGREYDRGMVEVVFLTWRELSVLVKMKSKIMGVSLVPVFVERKVKYEIHLEVEGEQGIEKCVLVTARKKPQAWSSLNKAICELEKYTTCESFEVVRNKVSEIN